LSEFTGLLILFAAGITGGFMNVMAGGGSSFTLPALIFLGLDSALANGTNRVAVVAQNISAVYAFKQEKYHEFRDSFKLSVFTLPGSIAGAVVATEISDELFQKILGIVMICVIILMLIPNPVFNKRKENTGIPWTLHLSMLGIGFYGGFMQVGVGFLIMAALQYLMKLNLLYVNMHKVFIVFLFMIPSLIVFWITGNVDWKYGLVLAAGNMLGAWWAAKLSVRKGEKIIRFFLTAAVFIMALKLLDVF
jgi:uncharacterized membrane protein YfcA